MRRDINSNGYIFLYSTVLVVVVAVLLSAAAIWLQPYQQRNKDNEKRVMILSAAGVNDDGKIDFIDHWYAYRFDPRHRLPCACFRHQRLGYHLRRGIYV